MIQLKRKIEEKPLLILQICVPTTLQKQRFQCQILQSVEKKVETLRYLFISVSLALSLEHCVFSLFYIYIIFILLLYLYLYYITQFNVWKYFVIIKNIFTLYMYHWNIESENILNILTY